MKMPKCIQLTLRSLTRTVTLSNQIHSYSVQRSQYCKCTVTNDLFTKISNSPIRVLKLLPTVTSTKSGYCRGLCKHKNLSQCRLFFARYHNSGKARKTGQNACETVESVSRKWEEVLNKSHIPEARVGVEYIVAYVLGRKTLQGVDGKHELNEEDVKLVNKLCEQRLQHKPIQYILGEWDFLDIELKMRPPVFIPRPETEELVDTAIKMMVEHGQHTRRVLELCCGSGAITLSLLHRFPFMHGVAVDISPEACSLTSENASRLGMSHRVTVVKGDVAEKAVQETLLEFAPFDLIVSNPPYIPSHRVLSLEPQILRYEDLKALDGGTDGLDVVREILNLPPQLLNPNSDILLEIDPGQPEMIRHILTTMEHPSFHFVSSLEDYLGRERFCHLRRR